MQAVEAGAALTDALKREMRDPRTWETQYHMVMALAESGATNSLPLLHEIADMHLEHTMVLVAAGDAITRFEYRNSIAYRSLRQWLDKNAKPLIEGGFRAVAMLHLTPEKELIDKIIAYVSRPDNEHLRFWVAAACPAWDGDGVSDFLQKCLEDPLDDTRRAAEAALEKKYLKWKPL